VTEANQTQVPAEIRARFGVSPGDVLVWEETPGGELRVRFRRKHRLQDLVGLAGKYPPRSSEHDFDAVRDKKRAQRREL
jgi:bifunctional DNA-binding transcriptional regulator/antitoxin component of YhaV-PrlF toxin-antitoxin module